MTTRNLILAVLGIFIIAGISYAGIAPIANRILNGDAVSEATTTPAQEVPVATTTPTISEIPVTEEPAPEPTPVPVPEPTPTPAPAPEPEPVQTSFTASEVAVHNSEGDCWSIINGAVYDLTTYVPKHPGGKKNILKICGKDGSNLFEGQHGGESKPENILARYWIGTLR